MKVKFRSLVVKVDDAKIKLTLKRGQYDLLEYDVIGKQWVSFSAGASVALSTALVARGLTPVQAAGVQMLIAAL